MRIFLLLLCTTLGFSTACSTTQTKRTSKNITLAVQETINAQEAGIAKKDGDVTVVNLVQRPCRFVEAEPNVSFDDKQTAEACKTHNNSTIEKRQQRAIRIPAGKVRFVVSSEKVPYTLGFWIRDLKTPKTAIVQGGGIESGQPKTYETTLKPGTYLYACPLNPTPDYTLIVE